MGPMWIGLTCFFSLLFISADKSAERSKSLLRLKLRTLCESVNARLDEEINWLRSLVEQYYQGGARWTDNNEVIPTRPPMKH